jgi:signal transduction histidine kinase
VTGTARPRITGTATARRLGHVGAVLIVLLGAVLPAGPRQAFIWDPEVLAVNAGACVLVLLRHRHPRATLGCLLALMVVTVPLDLVNIGTASAVAVATYAVMFGLGRRPGALVTLGVAVLSVACALAVGATGPQYGLVVLLGGALGSAISSQRAVVAAATERAERAERTQEALARQRVAEDRLGIARDLHDVVAHQIAVINLHAGAATGALRDRPEDAERSLTIIRQASRTVLTEIGDLLHTLRDPAQATIGPPGLAQLDDVVRELAVHGLDVTVRVSGEPEQPSGTVDVTALRVIQEALTNAHKHGSEGRAHVLVEHLPRSLHLSVANPVPPGAAPGAGIGTRQGLVGMAERVESVRGTLTYGATGTGTWLVVADLPYGSRPDETPPEPHPTDPHPHRPQHPHDQEARPA